MHVECSTLRSVHNALIIVIIACHLLYVFVSICYNDIVS